ncbi:hypothetical protein ACF06X_33535 [Streptomyces sp. NPDC015346]|uniref:hypothetical protein n=1 Tax=Streptomyces sp. NPDC015346 TaxID=3364954 RepID=UPI0036FE0BC7
MSVYSPARPQNQTADYNQLGTHTQALLDHLLAQADNTVDATEYRTLMEMATHLAGLTLPKGHDIAKCACPKCYCSRIFDTAAPGLTVVETSEYNLPLLQCQDCTDQHPAPIED